MGSGLEKGWVVGENRASEPLWKSLQLYKWWRDLKPRLWRWIAILPRVGLVHRLAWGSNSPSVICRGNVSMWNNALRHRGRRERVCRRDSPHNCLSIWWIQGVLSRGLGNTSYLPNFRESTCPSTSSINVQGAFLRYSFITLEGPTFPLLLSNIDNSFECQLENPDAIYSSPAMEHGGQEGESSQSLWDKTKAKDSKTISTMPGAKVTLLGPCLLTRCLLAGLSSSGYMLSKALQRCFSKCGLQVSFIWNT